MTPAYNLSKRDPARLRRVAARARDWAREARALKNPSTRVLQIAKAKERLARDLEAEARSVEGRS